MNEAAVRALPRPNDTRIENRRRIRRISPKALVQQLESFLLELGGDFAFVGRQHRLRIGDEWYRVDLLFFHRKPRSLIVIDLKLEKFTHADAGQMHLYLDYATEHWMNEGKNPPVGVILCTQGTMPLFRYALENLHSARPGHWDGREESRSMGLEKARVQSAKA